MTTEAKWSDFASMDGAKTLAAANQLLPGWVSLLLVVVIAWQLAKLAWMLVPAPASGDLVVTPANVENVQSSGSIAADVSAIANAHIFGVADSDDAVPEPVVEEFDNLRDTRLTNLSLKGTLASTPAEEAVAIIADGAKEEKVYTIGAPVTSGAKLHAVYADRVVLNEDGVLTNLKLPKEFPEGTNIAARRDTTLSTRQSAANTQSIQAVVAQKCFQTCRRHSTHPLLCEWTTTGLSRLPGA